MPAAGRSRHPLALAQRPLSRSPSPAASPATSEAGGLSSGHATMRVMREQRFSGQVAEGPRGSAVIVVPFDPDEVWGGKAGHPVGGTVNGRRVRGRITPGSGGWVFTLSPMWLRD